MLISVMVPYDVTSLVTNTPLCETIDNFLYNNPPGPGVGGTPRKIGWGREALFPNPLPYL